MGLITINGVDVPVAVNSLTEEKEEVGPRTRTATGALVVERRALKRGLQWATPPLRKGVADWWRAVLEGQHDVWRLSDSEGGEHLFSARGREAINAFAGSAAGAFSSTTARFGTRSFAFSASTTNLALPTTSIVLRRAGLTLAYWTRTAAGPNWEFVVASIAPATIGAGPTVARRYNSSGAFISTATGVSLLSFFSVGDGAWFAVLQSPAVVVYVSDMWVVDCALTGWTTAEVDALALGLVDGSNREGHRCRSPAVRVAGTYLEGLSTVPGAFEALGAVKTTPVPATIGGVHQAAHVLSVALEEV